MGRSEPLVRKFKIIVIVLISMVIISILGVLAVDHYVSSVGAKQIKTIENTQTADAVIVFGAAVFGNEVSSTLSIRLDMGYEVYKSGKATKIIVSGDHGRKNYDEVNAMRDYLVKKGASKEDIFMDHAGFNTYDTIYRAKDVFLVKNAILVTQREHLLRALYIAKRLGLNAQGIESGQYDEYEIQYQRPREYLARVKAFLQCDILHPKPKFLGEAISVSGSGVLTED